jgi:hypothetical protein
VTRRTDWVLDGEKAIDLVDRSNDAVREPDSAENKMGASNAKWSWIRIFRLTPLRGRVRFEISALNTGEGGLCGKPGEAARDVS